MYGPRKIIKSKITRRKKKKQIKEEKKKGE